MLNSGAGKFYEEGGGLGREGYRRGKNAGVARTAGRSRSHSRATISAGPLTGRVLKGSVSGISSSP